MFLREHLLLIGRFVAYPSIILPLMTRLVFGICHEPRGLPSSHCIKIVHSRVLTNNRQYSSNIVCYGVRRLPPRIRTGYVRVRYTSGLRTVPYTVTPTITHPFLGRMLMQSFSTTASVPALSNASTATCPGIARVTVFVVSAPLALEKICSEIHFMVYVISRLLYGTLSCVLPGTRYSLRLVQTI